MRRARRHVCVTLLFLVAAALAGRAAAQTISATQEDPKTIRVVAAGAFETTFTLRKGFGSTWFDLKHDPDKKRSLAPVADENGFFWVKNCPGPERPAGGASWYANPAKEMTLLESNAVRARVRLKGLHMRYGSAEAKAAWNELGFELTWTVYADGAVYGDYVLVAEAPVKLHHFLAIVKSTGAWGKAGKGEGAKEVKPASEAGDGVKPEAPRNAGSWMLQYSNGPTYFTDILMVIQKGKFGGTYWNEGYEDKDYRTGLDIMSAFADRTVPAGRTPLRLMFRIADDMNSAADAAKYAGDYRSPDALAVTKGELDKADPGDDDADGFNEAEGCYVLKAAPDGVAFTLHGKATARMAPAFKVRGWPGEAPKTITLAGKTLTAGADYNAAVGDGTLLLHLLKPVSEDAAVVVGRN